MKILTDLMERRVLAWLAADPERLLAWLIKRAKSDKRRILLAAAPKSGSTYLTNLLVSLSGLKAGNLSADTRQREYKIYLPRLVGALDDDTLIGHQHLRANDSDIEILQAMGFRVVVLVRDFADTVVSLRDEQLKSSASTPGSSNEFRVLQNLPPEEHLWFIIRFYMPWFFGFYAGWKAQEQLRSLPVLWLRYEDLISHPHQILADTMDFSGFSCSREDIDAALKKAQETWTRRNVGIAGRGRKMLSPDQLVALEEMASLYPRIDFAPVGFGRHTN